jgi:hypothetical protein
MKARDIRFCSASTVFSVSSCLRISKAREATLTNFIARKDVLKDGISCGKSAGKTSYTASCPERRKTWDHHLTNISIQCDEDSQKDEALVMIRPKVRSRSDQCLNPALFVTDHEEQMKQEDLSSLREWAAKLLSPQWSIQWPIWGGSRSISNKRSWQIKRCWTNLYDSLWAY